jgi:hypothetical protein
MTADGGVDGDELTPYRVASATEYRSLATYLVRGLGVAEGDRITDELLVSDWLREHDARIWDDCCNTPRTNPHRRGADPSDAEPYPDGGA